MPFLIGLLTPVFSLRMCPLNPLFLPLAATQPVLMRHCGHQIDMHIIDGGYTAGFTEHVFALMPLLGFAFARRIRDLHDKRLFIRV